MPLPNDVVLRIISFMDIDTRRSLGIYAKLNVPDDLKSRITSCFREIEIYADHVDYNTAEEIENDESCTTYFVMLPFQGYSSRKNPMNCYYAIAHTFGSRGVFYNVEHARCFIPKHSQDEMMMHVEMHGFASLVEIEPDIKENKNTQYAYGYKNGKVKSFTGQPNSTLITALFAA